MSLAQRIGYALEVPLSLLLGAGEPADRAEAWLEAHPRAEEAIALAAMLAAGLLCCVADSI